MARGVSQKKVLCALLLLLPWMAAGELPQSLPIKNFERWLHQRDAEGFETRPAVRIQQPIKMWMVQTDRYYDYIARAGSRIGFHIDSRWPGMKGEMAVKVTYLDDKPGTLQLVCNAGDSVREQRLTGDGKLKTSTFMLPRLEPRSMEHEFDFVLQAGKDTGQITISMVRAVITHAPESFISGKST